MPELLAAASIFVTTAGAVSLLLLLPTVGLAETAGEDDAAGRARAWLAALLVPPLVGLLAAGCALYLHSEGLVASPHLGGQRPHLCLLPVYSSAAGAYRLSVYAWLSLALVVVAVLRLIAGAVSSHLLRRLAAASGARVENAGPGCAVYEVGLSRATSFSVGLLRPVVVLSSPLLGALAPESVAAIIAHERAHCRRRDTLASLLADASTALLLPLPTVHYYRAQWRAASEAAADDAALAAGARREHLLDALEALGATRPVAGPPSLAALLIPTPPVTQQRLRRLMREPGPQAHDTRPARALLWAIIVAILLFGLAMVLTSTRSVQDSLFCAAEQFTRATR